MSKICSLFIDYRIFIDNTNSKRSGNEYVDGYANKYANALPNNGSSFNIIFQID